MFCIHIIMVKIVETESTMCEAARTPDDRVRAHASKCVDRPPRTGRAERVVRRRGLDCRVGETCPARLVRNNRERPAAAVQTGARYIMLYLVRDK